MGVGKRVAVVVAVAIVVGVLLGAIGVRTETQEQAAGKSSVKAVRFGKLWDGKGKVWTNAVVIVEGGKIRSVGSVDAAIPASAEVIDLSQYSGLPGLIDVHTHMTMYT